MATTTKTLTPTNQTITLPDMTERPNASVLVDGIGKDADAINALSEQIGNKADYTYITATSSYDVQTTDAASALFSALPNNYSGIVKAVFASSFVGVCMVRKTNNNWGSAIVIVDGWRPPYYYNINQENVRVMKLAYVTE